MQSPAKIHTVESSYSDLYQEAVISAYSDPAEIWEKVLGETLSFNGGLFNEEELAAGPKPGPVGDSEFRGINRQLELAGLLSPDSRPEFRRILDLGCGWGVLTQYLAKVFPECQRIDAANISQQQLDYCAERLPLELRDRVNLYSCNVQDVDRLPDPAVPYDFIFIRGVWFHCLPSVFEVSVTRVAQRLRPGGILLLSDPLYRDTEESHVPDSEDGLGTRNHKTPEYYTSVLEKNGFQIQDLRVLPSNAEFYHWFQVLRLNIEANFPDFPKEAPDEVVDLHGFADSFGQKLIDGNVSMYSIVARRPAE
jgi:cyclopropane fatty-acyl-phospholipid synthase-like methyltransferase